MARALHNLLAKPIDSRRRLYNVKTYKKSNRSEKGFTLIELLVVAAIIGILLAIAIPNLIKAKISANEANARKAMQRLRDAKGEFFEQEFDDQGGRDITDSLAELRDAETTGEEEDALIDSSFTEDEDTDGGDINCTDPKAGCCITSDFAAFTANDTGRYDDFGSEASMTSFRKTDRKDFSVYGDGVVRCTVDGTLGTSDPGNFLSQRSDGACD